MTDSTQGCERAYVLGEITGRIEIQRLQVFVDSQKSKHRDNLSYSVVGVVCCLMEGTVGCKHEGLVV